MEKEDVRGKSYWLTTRDYRSNDSLEGEIKADVGIVGGGFPGLSPVYHLKKKAPAMAASI